MSTAADAEEAKGCVAPETHGGALSVEAKTSWPRRRGAALGP